MTALKVEPASLVRFQGMASLAPEKTLSDDAEVAGIAKIAWATLLNLGKRYLFP